MGTKKEYEEYLNEMEIPPNDLKSNGGRIKDGSSYGTWLRRNDHTTETDQGLKVPQRASERIPGYNDRFRYENEKTEQQDLLGTMKEIVDLGVMAAMDQAKDINLPVRATMIEEQLKNGGVQVVMAPQLFPTPPDIAERMVELAEIKPGMSVLEPSAGTGNIVRALEDEGGCSITGVEINSKLCELLRETFRFRQLVNDDFLSYNGNLGMFDRVVMNPPFENAVDIKHIEKAFEYLKPNGVLVALCANGPRQEKRFKGTADIWEVLPAGSFKGSGTMANVALIKITK